MTRRKRTAGFFMLGFMLLFLAFNIYTNRLIGNLLKDLVAEKSKGLYHLDYALLQVNFFTNELIIKNLSLQLDSALHLELVQDRLVKRNFFEVYVRSAWVGVKDIPAIYFDKELHLTGIKIDQPLFKVAAYEALNKAEKKESFKGDNLQKIILRSLNLFKINNFEMVKGSFDVSHFKHAKTLSYSLNNLSINFNNLLIDTLSTQSDKAFFTDTLEVNLKDYYLQLADNQHFLRIGEIGVSTSDSVVFFKNLQVAPLPNAPPDTAGRALYHIEIPEFKVSGLHFQKAYAENRIELNRIHLKKAKIDVRFLKNPKTKNKNKLTNEQMIGTVFKYLKSLKINHFWIDSIALNLERPDSVGNLSFDDISLELHRFELDSANWKTQSKHLFAQDIDFSIRNHDFKLPDKLHELHATELSASTRRKEIRAKNVSIRPQKHAEKWVEQGKAKASYQIYLPEVWIEGVDFWKAKLNADFQAHSIQIKNPQIKAFRKESGTSQMHAVNVLNLYPLIAENVKSLSVRNFNLKEADFSLVRLQKSGRNELNIKNLSINFQNFLINAWAHRNPNKIFYSDAIEVQMKAHTFDLPDSIHVLKVNDLYLSTAAKKLRLGQSEIVPHHKAHEFDPYHNRMEIRFNSLILNEFDLKKAFSQQIFEIGSVVCEAPQIKIQIKSFRDSTRLKPKKAIPLSEIFQKLTVGEIRITKGSLDFKGREKNNALIIKHFDTRLANFWADTLALAQNRFHPEADSVEFEAEDFTLLLPKIEHAVKSDFVRASSEKQALNLQNLTFTPIFSKNRTRTQIHLTLPNLRFEGLNPIRLFFDKELIAKQLEIKQANLFFQLAENSNPKTASSSSFSLDKTIFEPLKKTGLEIRIDSLLLLSSHLTLQNDQQKQITFLENFDLKIKDLHIRNDLKLVPDRFFYAQNVMAQVPVFWQETPKNWVWVKNLGFETEKQSLQLDSAFISNRFEGKLNRTDTISPQKMPNFYTIRLARTAGEGFDFFETFVSKKLKIRQLETKNPIIQYALRQARTPQAKPFEWDSLYLYPYIRSLLYSVDIANFGIENLTFERNFWKENQEKKEIWKKIDTKIADFYIDSLARMNWERPFFAKNIDVRMRDYEIPLKDEFYRLKTKAVGIGTAQGKIFVDTLQYIPLYSKEEFAAKKGVQAVRMEMVLEKTELLGTNWAKLLKTRALQAKKLNMADLQFHSFMDRNYPLAPLRSSSLDAPWTLFLKTKQFIDIDTVRLINLDIFYEERSKRTPQTGTLSLTNGKIELFNFTNNPEKLANKVIMGLRSSIELMGEGEIHLTGNFPLADSLHSFSFVASMGAMDMTLLNNYLEKPYGVKIRKGEAQNMQLLLKGNEKVAYGNLQLLYKHLHIGFVDTQDQTKGLKLRFLSFLANTFLRNSNLKLLKKRYAEIYVERDPAKPMYSMLLKALTAGMKMNVGLNDRKMRKLYKERTKTTKNSE